MKVLINHDKGTPIHSADWTRGWIKYCENHDIEYEMIDLLKVDAISTLKNFDVLLWHFGNYSYKEML